MSVVADTRHLPSLDALRVFEVAVRRLSFSRAADDLGVTQSAVSHRIRELEQVLRKRLFVRAHGTLQLTEPGRILAEGLQRGMAEIRDALSKVNENCPQMTLTLSVATSFAAKWLVPRLLRFRERYPRINLVVQAEDQEVDLAAYSADCAIRFGAGRYHGLEAVHLFGDSTVPVCSPRLAERFGPVREAADLLKFPLLQDGAADARLRDESGADWGSWFRGVGVSRLPALEGLRFSSAGLAIEAAANDVGLALARTSLLGDDLTTGRLVCPVAMTVPARHAYYLVSLPRRSDDSRVRALRAWLLHEARRATLARGTSSQIQLPAEGNTELLGGVLERDATAARSDRAPQTAA